MYGMRHSLANMAIVSTSKADAAFFRNALNGLNYLNVLNANSFVK
jgi:hypothetical protein